MTLFHCREYRVRGAKVRLVYVIRQGTMALVKVLDGGYVIVPRHELKEVIS
jgi:hypothetical protein